MNAVKARENLVSPTRCPDRVRESGTLPPSLQSTVISLHEGQVFLERPDVPIEVAPGGTIDIDTRVVNTDRLISDLDPDSCNSDDTPCGFRLGNGYCYLLQVVPSWTGGENVGPTCIDVAGFTSTVENHDWVFPAPQEEGTYNVTFELRLMGTGQFGTFDETIEVVEGAPDRPGDGNGDDEDDVVDQAITILVLVAVIAGLALTSQTV